MDLRQAQHQLIVLFNAGRYAELEATSLALIKYAPDFAFAWKALSAAQKMQGKSALRSAAEAARLLPLDHEAHNTLGLAQKDAGLYGEAIASYRKAIDLKSGYVEARNNLGHILGDLGRYDEATEVFEQAIAIAPDSLDLYDNLLFTRQCQIDASPAVMLAEAKQYGLRAAMQARPFTSWGDGSAIDAKKRLKVGFVSGDFRTHPVGFFLESIIGALRAVTDLEFVAYSNNVIKDDLTLRLRANFNEWHDVVGMAVAAMAQLIHDHQVDVLIDLSGHTAHNRLPVFAWKPAPIQASWLGYVGTTGLAEMDYFIADRFSVPQPRESQELPERQFMEKVWRLPRSMICFTPPAFDLPVRPPPAIDNGYITFGSFNNLTKMNGAVFKLWSQLLHAVPDSRILLNTKQLGDAAVREETWRQFAAQGIGNERVILEYITPRANSLAAYSRIDIALDPFPYNGGTTTAEALWMGVPVLTLSGERLVSRMGVSLLTNAGLADWIAEDEEDFLAKAQRLVDLVPLAVLRGRLRAQVMASPLFDAQGFAQDFEAALRGMWIEWAATR